MLPSLPGLELRLVVGEGGGNKSSLGRQNMENEIEQTAERLTEGAWWIYCYWPQAWLRWQLSAIISSHLTVEKKYQYWNVKGTHKKKKKRKSRAERGCEIMALQWLRQTDRQTVMLLQWLSAVLVMKVYISLGENKKEDEFALELPAAHGRLQNRFPGFSKGKYPSQGGCSPLLTNET